MRRAFLFAVLLAASLVGSGQSNLDKRAFNEKFETVRWLCLYDIIAWWTSDSAMAAQNTEHAEMGKEWFCYPENGIWHAVFGQFKDGKYDLAYHYIVDTNTKVIRQNSPVDTFLLNSYSRAINNAYSQLSDTLMKVRFNQYVRRNEDQTLSVWLLPAFTTDGIAVYGGEFYYEFDPSGNTLFGKSEYYQGYRGFKTDKSINIWLDYGNQEQPTLGSIFFAWYYKKYFNSITIVTKSCKSTVYYDTDRKDYFWTYTDEGKQ